MEQPQSELFDAGFQSVRFYEERDRVLVGAEDGAINIFNINEWGNISDRYPIRCSAGRASGLCSIDHMEVLSMGDDQASVVILGVGDGKIRAMSVLPNKIIAEGECHPSSVESLAACSTTKQVASSDTNCIFIHELIINETGDDQEGPQVSAGDSASNVSTSSSGKKVASSSSMTNFFADL